MIMYLIPSTLRGWTGETASNHTEPDMKRVHQWVACRHGNRLFRIIISHMCLVTIRCWLWARSRVKRWSEYWGWWWTWPQTPFTTVKFSWAKAKPLSLPLNTSDFTEQMPASPLCLNVSAFPAYWAMYCLFPPTTDLTKWKSGNE